MPLTIYFPTSFQLKRSVLFPNINVIQEAVILATPVGERNNLADLGFHKGTQGQNP